MTTPEAYDIKLDKQAEWQTKLDDFYDKVKGGHWGYIQQKDERGVIRLCDRRKSQTRERCDCCGNRMLKTLFPILKDGKVFWIGSECMTELQRRGLRTSLEAIE